MLLVGHPGGGVVHTGRIQRHHDVLSRLRRCVVFVSVNLPLLVNKESVMSVLGLDPHDLLPSAIDGCLGEEFKRVSLPRPPCLQLGRSRKTNTDSSFMRWNHGLCLIQSSLRSCLAIP